MPRTRRRPHLYYERHGDGEPLLFITGFTISCAVFEPVIPAYAKRFECIMYDNRGSGRSSAPLWPTSIPELAGDAVGLLDELGVRSAHVYGLSMGGMVAQELAIRFPERVRGLVLGCSTPGGPRASRPGPRALWGLGSGAVGALRQPGRPWLGALVFSPEFRREHPGEVRRLLTHFHRHLPKPHSAAWHWWASVYHDTVSRLDRIEAPTLVMHGERDRMAPLANARMLADRIPDARVALVPGAGHAYLLESPDVSFELMTDWLDERGPIGPGAPRGSVERALEPVSRRLGLPVGAVRTGRSLVGVAAGRLGLSL